MHLDRRVMESEITPLHMAALAASRLISSSRTTKQKIPTACFRLDILYRSWRSGQPQSRPTERVSAWFGS